MSQLNRIIVITFQSHIKMRRVWIIQLTILFYFFTLSSGLVSEVFLIPFFTIVSWNIDRIVARKVLLVWVYTMYIGQAAKDIMKVPRPHCPPVIKVEVMYETEYGMPSTHAIAGTVIPTSLVTLVLNTYTMSTNGALFCIVLAVALSISVCISRVYMGVHTFLDVIIGGVSALILLALIMPCMDVIDKYQVTGISSPIVMVSVPLFLAILYPLGNKWSPARSDTTIMLGTAAGTSLGEWVYYNIQGGIDDSLHFTHGKYSVQTVILLIVRTVTGVIIILMVRLILKPVVTFIMHCLLSGSKQTVRYELPVKFTTYLGIALSATALVPHVFYRFNVNFMQQW